MTTRFKFLSLLLAVCVGLFLYVHVSADSGRESKELPPLCVEQMYATEWYALSYLDDSGVSRFEVDNEGNINLFNSSGTTKVVLGSDGSFTAESNVTITGYLDMGSSIRKSATSPTATANVGYIISGNYDLYLIDTDPKVDISGCSQGGGSSSGPVSTAGVTVTLPAPSAALNGWNPTFYKIDSGATDMFFVVSGGSNVGYGYVMYGGDGNSGVTNGDLWVGALDLDGFTDRIKFQYYYVSSSVSGVYVDEMVIDGQTISGVTL